MKFMKSPLWRNTPPLRYTMVKAIESLYQADMQTSPVTYCSVQPHCYLPRIGCFLSSFSLWLRTVIADCNIPSIPCNCFSPVAQLKGLVKTSDLTEWPNLKVVYTKVDVLLLTQWQEDFVVVFNNWLCVVTAFWRVAYENPVPSSSKVCRSLW